MLNLRLSALLAAWLLLLVGAGEAASPLVEVKDLKQPVAAGAPVTDADLLKLVFPEPPPGQEKKPQTPPVRSLSDYFKEQPLTAKQRDGGVMALPIKAQGRPLLLLLVAATGESAEGEGVAGERNITCWPYFKPRRLPSSWTWWTSCKG